MPRKKEPPLEERNNVIPLRLSPRAPHPDRLAAMQEWHQDKAASANQDVAAIHMSITTTGTVKTEGVGMEPEHALALLNALPKVIARLEIVAGVAPQRVKEPAAVYQLVRRAQDAKPGHTRHLRQQKSGYPGIIVGTNSGGMSDGLLRAMLLTSRR